MPICQIYVLMENSIVFLNVRFSLNMSMLNFLEKCGAILSGNISFQES